MGFLPPVSQAGEQMSEQSHAARATEVTQGTHYLDSKPGVAFHRTHEYPPGTRVILHVPTCKKLSVSRQEELLRG